MLVVNAGNIMKDHEWIVAQARVRGGDVAVVNASSRYALIAIQGPQAQAILQTLTDIDLSAIKYYWFATGEVAGIRATVSRTGYTGEDGFEVFVPPAQAERVVGRAAAGGQARATSSAAASVRATRCDSRRPCACAAATWTSRRRCSKRASAGSWAGRRPISRAPRCCASRRPAS